MPQVTVYIRDSDLLLWKSIPKKTEFIHTSLHNLHVESTNANSTIEKDRTFVPKAPDPETGYPCCQKASPCKHWAWGSDNQYWVNSLTGRKREE